MSELIQTQDSIAKKKPGPKKKVVQIPQIADGLARPAPLPVKKTKADFYAKMEAQKERDQEMVVGIFNYREKPKGKLQFTFSKYADDGFKRYELEDGKRYKLPRMVAAHLNKNCFYIEYAPAKGPLASAGTMEAATGNESTYSRMYAVNKLHRTEFRSLEFMDDDLDAPVDLVQMVYR